MAYKRYFKRGGKVYGPYYYESYRDSAGVVRKRYVGTVDPNDKKKSSKNFFRFKFLLFFVLGLVVLTGFFGFFALNESVDFSKFTGRVIEEEDEGSSKINLIMHFKSQKSSHSS